MNFFKLCLSLFKENSLYYFLMIFLLNSLIAYSVVITIFKIVQQYFLSGRFKDKIFRLENIQLTNSLKNDFMIFNQALIVIDHRQPMAFTMGLRKPCIVLSSRLLEMLDHQELEAVIEHETFHQNNHDSIKIFILHLISHALWFIPLTKWTYKNYIIISELLADEFAVQRTGSEIGLGSALLKLINSCFSEKPNPMLVYFSEAAVNYRLEQLINPERKIPIRMETKSIVLSIHVLLLFMGMIVLAIT
ncbi:M56 family metallopeptidase [Cohnella sp.]|uniref:M56 family metallopeptidase n=1 Tax=Cohnella sp. TaxID=1883426 RepID=UPI003561FB3F